ncbi:MAG: putative glycolipid-binding domain-containing protein [Jatrophihabitans sp.]|uniref:putative glycolipid-binding domain-containing protein n=1 Tax=Jatrophihabitans sp. TaxID=1932789 RepID=UPI003912D0CF
MGFADLPTSAVWDHVGGRRGFEAASITRADAGWTVTGSTTAIEEGVPWWVAYEIELSSSFVTRRAQVTGRSGSSPPSSVLIEGDGRGGWAVDGRHEPVLDGCLDVDLESSALTNTFPLRRLDPRPGNSVSVPAVYVRAHGLAVERLEQLYERSQTGPTDVLVDYAAPTFDFACRIAYDVQGLVVDYPGIARRVK